ncbi:MAG TPA: hypothetical protein VHT23_09545 [Gemmatimonadaceae bacterium]|jgi:hypothetical protein|nr:hypothetical protein [Gemmatimonadaceae bacterium]
MIEHDFDEEFVPIAAELQRLPYLSPSRDFADRVISRIDRLQPAPGVAPVVASRHLELHQGGQQAVVRRRSVGLVRGTAKATAVVGLLAAATFMFFEIDMLTAILSAAVGQYAFAIAAVGAQVGTMVLGADTIAFLQAGALGALLLYLTLAAGLFGGYAAIRTAANIAKRKAA